MPCVDGTRFSGEKYAYSVLSGVVDCFNADDDDSSWCMLLVFVLEPFFALTLPQCGFKLSRTREAELTKQNLLVKILTKRFFYNLLLQQVFEYKILYKS